jgi:predicted kinase
VRPGSRRLVTVPRLIVLNGPPGIGKSTVARRYVDEHPLALNVDVDRLRDLIGGWRDHPHEAGLHARAVALAAARTHLAAGHDVVVPQFVARPDFLDQLALVAAESGAEFYEIVLLDTKEHVLRRFADRSRAAADPTHVAAQEMLDRHGGVDELAAMYDRLLAVVAERPSAVVVPTASGDVRATYRDVLSELAESKR